MNAHFNKYTCTYYFHQSRSLHPLKKKSTLRTRHKTHTFLTRNFTAACVVIDGEIRTIRESCILLHCTPLMLEELIIHRSTIGSFISLAFSVQTIMYFFPPTDPVTLNFSAECSKDIRKTFLFLECSSLKETSEGTYMFPRVSQLYQCQEVTEH